MRPALRGRRQRQRSGWEALQRVAGLGVFHGGQEETAEDDVAAEDPGQWDAAADKGPDRHSHVAEIDEAQQRRKRRLAEMVAPAPPVEIDGKASVEKASVRGGGTYLLRAAEELDVVAQGWSGFAGRRGRRSGRRDPGDAVGAVVLVDEQAGLVALAGESKARGGISARSMLSAPTCQKTLPVEAYSTDQVRIQR